MASKAQTFVTKYDITYTKRYPSAPVKRIYARPKLVPVVKQTKAQATLAKILEG